MRLTLEAAIFNGDDTFDSRAFNGLSKCLLLVEAQAIDNGGGIRNLLEVKVLIGSKAARRQLSTASRQDGGDLYEVIDGRHFFEGVEFLLVEGDAEGHPVLSVYELVTPPSLYCCELGDAAVCGLQGPFEGR